MGSTDYQQTHWAIRLGIVLLFVLTAFNAYQLNRNTHADHANVCLTGVLVSIEFGSRQFTADQDYDEWRRSVADDLLECLEDYKDGP